MYTRNICSVFCEDKVEFLMNGLVFWYYFYLGIVGLGLWDIIRWVNKYIEEN